MDSRSFSIGIVYGVLIGALAVWLIGGSGGDEVRPGAEIETIATSIPEAATVAPAVGQQPQEPPPESNPDGNDLQSSLETTAGPAVPWPENLRAELNLELREDSWAYYMEQTLLQYLGNHSSMTQFDISSVDCRTTKCLIEVTGYDESTVPVWQNVMYDIRQQSWSEFGQHGTSSGVVDGRITIIGTLQRAAE